MPQTKLRQEKHEALIDAIGIAIFAIIIELIGRSIFSVYDTNNQVYGARFWAETGMPWMHVWMGLDLIVGSVTKALGDPLLAITVLGCAVNAIASVSIYVINNQLGIHRFGACVIALVTALWFLPHLGGWVGDNLSFLIGITPALIYAASRQQWTNALSIGLGITIAIGATLKLNAFVPAFAVSILWLTISSIDNYPSPLNESWQKISSNLIRRGITICAVALASGIALNWLITTETGLYTTVVETYMRVSQSVASSQVSSSRLLQIPLGVDLIDAFNKGQKGVLIFSPLVLGFWITIIFSGQQFLSAQKSSQQRHLHSFALFLVIASALTCVGLGRGLTHRMLLLPTGVLISFSAFPLSKKQLQFWLTAICAASFASWITFSWIQHTTDISSIYDTRKLAASSQEKMFCLVKNHTDNELGKASKNVSSISATVVDQAMQIQGDRQCWTAQEFQRDFAGLPYTQPIANGMGVIYLNERPGQTVFYEKWDRAEATQKGMKDWVEQEVKTINSLKMPYFIERLELNDAELEAPSYLDWEKLRQDRLQLLSSKLKAVKIASIGKIGIWKTKWAEKADRDSASSNY